MTIGRRQNPLTIPRRRRCYALGNLRAKACKIGAAIGREFSYPLLAAVSPLADAELDSALDQLVASELVFRRGVPPEATYSFKHALVQDAAYQSLLKSKRQQLHARIAEVLEQRFPDVAKTRPEVLAHHSAEAGLVEKAVSYWEKAARQSAERSAMVEAVAQSRNGLDLLQRLPDDAGRSHRELELQTTLAAALVATVGNAAVETGLATLDRTDERWFEAELHRLRGQYFVAHQQGTDPAAEACFRRALAVGQEQGAKLWELRAATSLARLWRDQGRRMLLIGYCYSIRSERRLCDEVRFNLAYRWFCGLGLEAAVPHHSTFSVNRHGRFRESATFRLVFESVVARCMKVGLVGGEGFAVDASVVEADASRYRRVAGGEVDWSDEQKAQRPVREYLAALESENSPVNPGQAPKAMSPSDPAAAWTTRGRHKVQFAYSVNHLVDLLDGVIVDVEATPTRISMEVDVVETMLDRVETRFDLKPERITADVAYGTGDLLGAIVARNIAPHIPVWDKGKRDNGTFSREDFRFEPDRDLYICPRGNALKTTGKVHDGRTLLYRASKHDCDPCPLKLRCCPKEPARKIPRDVNEAARDLARGLMQTEGYRVSARQRKMIETGFGDMKRNLGLTRLRLRGLTGANDEFLLAATVQNLRRLAQAIWPSPEPTTSPTTA